MRSSITSNIICQTNELKLFYRIFRKKIRVMRKNDIKKWFRSKFRPVKLNSRAKKLKQWDNSVFTQKKTVFEAPVSAFPIKKVKKSDKNLFCNHSFLFTL